MYKVLHYPEVEEDLLALDDDVLLEVLKYFEKYKDNPFVYSAKLFDQGDILLKGYRKTYLAEAKYRIVIHVQKGVTKIVEVVAVGARDAKKIYKSAHNRVQEKKSK